MNVDGPKLDVGAYAKALEYACNIEATVIGKPQTEYFDSAVNDMGLDRDDVNYRNSIKFSNNHID